MAASELPIMSDCSHLRRLVGSVPLAAFPFVVGIGVALVSVLFAVLVSLHVATPNALLITTFLLGIGGALSAPAWVSISPLLVPRRDLGQAIAANTTGYNLSRAAGPAMGGLIIAYLGIAAPFWIYGVSNIVVLAALLWWREPEKASDSLPAERLLSAIRTGMRHAKNNLHLRATLARAIAFFPFASAYWALLPLVARAQMTQGPEFYGLLLGSIGVGAIGGSLLGAPHRYRIDWNPASVNFYVDGSLVHSELLALTTSMRPAFSDWYPDPERRIRWRERRRRKPQRRKSSAGRSQSTETEQQSHYR